MSRTLVATDYDGGTITRTTGGNDSVDYQDELKAMLKAVKDLQTSDSDTLVEAIDGLIEAVIATGARLTYLNTWLESRGLPLDWTGPLDHARWIHLSATCAVYASCVCVHPEIMRDGTFWLRWDLATPEQRAEALRIEAGRRNG